MRKHCANAFILTAFLAFISGCSSSSVPTATSEVWSGDDIAARSTFDTNAHYVFYIHGKILEDEGLNAVHPEYGRYEYLETLSYLASSGGQIISEVRQAGTDAEEYAETVVSWITRLLEAGVPPQNISVVGFSKGAFITLLVSDMLQEPLINFVVIAICGDWLIVDTDIRLTGRVLSLFETSDDYGGSCRELIERSPGVSKFQEISYSTGEGHGAFYQADSFWLDDVVEWITTNN